MMTPKTATDFISVCSGPPSVQVLFLMACVQSTAFQFVSGAAYRKWMTSVAEQCRIADVTNHTSCPDESAGP